MPDHSTRLALPFIQPSQAQKHVTHNEALATLDTLVQLAVEAVEVNIPPAAPDEGEVWAIGPAPEGGWAGEAGGIATLIDDTWRFIAPQEGWIALDKSTGRLLRQAGGAWGPLAPPDLVDLAGVGINAGFDAVNRLTVAAPATLFNHEGAGHQLKINKADEGDTASLLFQTGFGGRAEMGTAGSDDFAIKVSADAGTWFTALSLDAASGLASGTAVQQAAGDATVGRLMRVGAFGWGQDGAQAVPVLADLDAPGTASGVYAVTTATTGATGPGTCLILRGGAGELAQILLDADGQRLAFRTYAGVAWGDWAALSGAHNITRVSGPGGSHVRYPDGTQICQHSLTLDAPDLADGALFHGASPTGWSYPAAFAPGTRPTLTASATTQDGLWISAVAGDHLTGSLRAHAATSIASAPDITVTAIGRWM